MRSTAHRRDDEGSALVLVLVFVLIVAVLIGALLNQSYTTFRTARVTKELTDRVFAANGGVEWGLQQVRRGVTVDGAPACVEPPTGLQQREVSLTPTPLVLNGRTVTVTCEVLAGHAPGAGGWAAYITGDDDGDGVDDDGISVLAGTDAEKVVQGPVHNAGGFFRDVSNTVLRIVRGDVRSCRGDPPALVLGPLTPYTTTTACGSASVPKAPIPVDYYPGGPARIDAPPQPAAGNGQTSGCRTFGPGRYFGPAGGISLLPNTDGVNYLRSGVYYFDDMSTVDLSNVVVVGGIPAERETAVTAASALADAAGCPFESPEDTGGHYGVMLVLGQATRLDFGTGAVFEMFGYVEPAVGKSAAMSVLQLRDEWLPDNSFLRATDPPIVETRLGSETDVAFHGTVFTPLARVSAFGTTNSRVSFLGGVVAAGLDIQAAGHPGQASVSTLTGPGSRTMRIVSTTNRVGNEKTIRTIADVEVLNDAGRTVNVTSWTVEQ